MKGCEDADECFTLVHECPVHTDCINRPGGYVCVQTTCEVPADYELCPAPSTPCGTIKVGNIATDTYDFVLDVETGSANMPVELAGISNVLIVQPYCNLAIHADFDNFAGGFNCENMSNGESKICYTGSGHHSYTCECDASMTPTDPSWCNFHVGEMMEVEGEDCGLVHCVDNASGFNCACFDPIDPKAWSVQKLVLSTDMGWAQETVEGAKAKCASMGYEINEIRYKYQFTDMVDHFGIEKLDNVWAGMKFSEMTEYEIPGWVTELTDELVNFRTTDKDVWHATEPSNNDEDEHPLCAQFMDGKLDDSYCELKKDFVCYNTPEILDCGCTPGQVAGHAIKNVGANERALAVCELQGGPNDGDSGKGAIWSIACDSDKNGKIDKHEFRINRLLMPDSSCQLEAELSCDVGLPANVSQERKCNCSKYVEDFAEVTCAGRDLYVCRGTDGQLHRIQANKETCSDIANQGVICIKKDDESFSNAQENAAQSSSSSDSPAHNPNITIAAPPVVENKPLCGCRAQVQMFKDITCIAPNLWACTSPNGTKHKFAVTNNCGKTAKKQNGKCAIEVSGADGQRMKRTFRGFAAGQKGTFKHGDFEADTG